MINERTLDLIGRMRADLDHLADDLTRDLTRAWAAEWDHVVYEMASAITELVRIRDDRWPTRRQVARSEQTQRALATAAAALGRLAARARRQAETAALSAARTVIAAQANMIVSQLPAEAAATFRPREPDPADLEQAHKETRRNLGTYLAPLAPAAARALRNHLQRGAPHAAGPAGPARDVLRNTEGAFNAGLGRALLIGHTELFDAARTAAMLSQLANADVLTGWTWLSRRDRRTCPACWAQDGNTFPLDQPGPWDHQRGRCVRVPETKSWRDLGFPGIPETVGGLPSAEEAFRALSRADQLAVMGPARLGLLDRGDVAWSDLARLQQNPGWRPAYVMTPVRDLAV